MPQPRKRARLVKWRKERNGPEQWWLFYRDARTGKQRRILCEAHGATNPAQRQELVRQYRTIELQDEAEAARRGGRLAFDTSLLQALDDFLTRTEERRKVRTANPDSREGISDETAKALKDAVAKFQEWLRRKQHHGLTTSSLDASTLGRFFDFLATEKTRHGNREVRRTAVTVNKYRRHLRACFNYLNTLRPVLFPDFGSLLPAFKATRAEPKQPTAYTPDEMAAFVDAALEREEAGRTVAVERQHRGKKRKSNFTQVVASFPETPVSSLALLLILTGCRLSEAENLKWADVDLERGRITFHSRKTGRARVLPLVGAPEGDIAPTFVDVLAQWKLQAGRRGFVLPHGELPRPKLSKGAWQAANEKAKVRRIGPQRLRQNFTSYAASLGIPATVSALWQGHGVNVAERHYRAQVLERAQGKTLEEITGIQKLLENMLPEGVQARRSVKKQFPNLARPPAVMR